MSARPHLVIFNPDQWRGDALGHMGNPAVHTPNLDAFAAQDAVSFRNAFCQNPVCTPSRCSFMTGWYPHVRGHRTMHHMLQPDEPCLLKRLKDHGYYVWWGGKNDLVPRQNGFSAYCDCKNSRLPWPVQPGTHDLLRQRAQRGDPDFYSFYLGELPKEPGEEFYRDGDWGHVAAAIEFLANYDGRKPLCLYLPLHAPHPPYAVEEPWYSMNDRARVPPPLPPPPQWRGKPRLLRGIHRRQGLESWSEARWRELRATYYGMCSRTDALFGRLVQALKARGLYDDTAVFVFSDHGDFTGDYGLVEKTQNTFEDCLTRVPLLVKPPRALPVKPGVNEALVELIDFTATVEALAGLPREYDHFGRSLLPLIAGEATAHRDAVFCEGGRLEHEEQASERETASSTDPAEPYWPRVNLQVSDPVAHTKAVMCRTAEWKYVYRLYEDDELYDLRRDPGELDNRIGDPSCAPALAQLKERLLRFFVETADVVPLQTDQR